MSPVGFLYCTRECPCFGGKKREEGWWPDLRESLLLWKRKPKYLLFFQESSFNPVIGTFAGGQVFLSVSLAWVCICMHKPALSRLRFASLALTTRGCGAGGAAQPWHCRQKVMRTRHREALCYVPASTSVAKRYAFLQNALGAVDESWSLLEGQQEGHPWPTSGIAKL